MKKTSLSSPAGSLTERPSYRRIAKLENLYCQTLLSADQNFENAIQTFYTLKKISAKIRTYVRSLKTNSSTLNAAGINAFLDDDLKTFESIDSANSFWLSLYIGLTWPADVDQKNLRRLGNTFTKEHWVKEAQDNWARLAIFSSLSLDEKLHAASLLDIKAKRDSFSLNTSAWRENNRKFFEKLQDILICQLNLNRQKVDQCFKKTLFAGAAALKSSLEPTFPTAVNQEKDAFRQKISDWVAGYKLPGQAETAAEEFINKKVSRQLAVCELRRTLKLIIRTTLLGLLGSLLVFGIHSSRIDKQVYLLARDQIQKFLKRDPASLNLKAKKAYFHKYILDIDNHFDAASLSTDLDSFIENRIFESPGGYQYFSEKILPVFFPLLCEGKISFELKSKIVTASSLLDQRLPEPIDSIIAFFEQKLIRESKLKDEILKVRRVLVEHDIFPFSFIILDEGNPYLLFFPEDIQKKYYFSAEDFERLGLNLDYYSKRAKFPLEAYVVKSDRYPFKERAGYFEGEFAIVFADLALDAQWTAWHEFGHVIENLRLKYGGQRLPANIEINAVLFPVLFADDAKDYLINRVLPIIQRPHPEDVYVQAAKGLLNGLSLFVSEKKLAYLAPITDKLLAKDILAHENLIYALNEAQLKEAALALYKDPQKYLSTAKPGKYRGVITNAEEVIAGTPRAPYQGFILQGVSAGGARNSAGVQFLFDGMGQDEFAEKSIWVLLKQAFGLLLNPGASVPAENSPERLLAAVLTFFVIELFFILLHWLGTPFRKRKFNGRALADLIAAVYDHHPVSDGRSYGELLGERQLLLATFSCAGNIKEDLKTKIAAFKASASLHQRLLFDTLLTLAPLTPKKSAITFKPHDFLFWITFLGPWLARSPKIFPKQKYFHARELFNLKITTLAKRLNTHTPPSTFQLDYGKTIQGYKIDSPASVSSTKELSHYLAETEKCVARFFNEWKRTLDLQKPRLTNRTRSTHNQEGDFDRLDPYVFGDDIKRIDWKSTGRSGTFEAKVKKFAAAYSERVDFIFDFRAIDTPASQLKIARDLFQSLQLLGLDKEIKTLVLLMPDGEIRRVVLNLKSNLPLLELKDQIWSLVAAEFNAYEARYKEQTLRGLAFYTDEENAIYEQALALTDFNQPLAQSKELAAIKTSSLDIFLIGTEETEVKEIARLLPTNRPPFFWR